MPPYEINTSGDMFLMNEKGEPVKITRFSKMETCEVQIDPRIDLKELYLHPAEYEATIELTPESADEMAKLQEQLNAEIIDNLKKQIYAVNAVRMRIECCNTNENCLECPYFGKGCIDELLKDALAIADAYRRVLASGLEMMEEKSK